MRFSGLAVCLALCACRSKSPHRPAMPVTVALLSQEQVDVQADRLLQLNSIGARVSAVLMAQSVRDPAAAFNQAVFRDLGFVREVEDKSVGFSLLSDVISRRRGGCVGLGTLYLAIGELVQVPVEAVLVPGHFFVRVPDKTGRLRNVELLRQGEEMPERWYREKYQVPSAGAYLRPLSAQEVVAVVNFNRGNSARVGGRLVSALESYTQAAVAFPAFAEAHASLGLVRQLLGDWKGAAAAYERAAQEQPDLPGLQQNLAVLRQRLSASPP